MREGFFWGALIVFVLIGAAISTASVIPARGGVVARECVKWERKMVMDFQPFAGVTAPGMPAAGRHAYVWRDVCTEFKPQ